MDQYIPKQVSCAETKQGIPFFTMLLQLLFHLAAELPRSRVRYGVDGRWILGIAVPAQYVPATCGWFNQFEPSWSPVFLSHGVFEARHWCWTFEMPP